MHKLHDCDNYSLLNYAILCYEYVWNNIIEVICTIIPSYFVDACVIA